MPPDSPELRQVPPVCHGGSSVGGRPGRLLAERASWPPGELASSCSISSGGQPEEEGQGAAKVFLHVCALDPPWNATVACQCSKSGKFVSKSQQ